MCRLFETIRIEDGRPLHLPWHEARMERSMPGSRWTDLEKEILVPAESGKGTVRCRVDYGKEINSVVFSVYERQPVRSLRLVYNDLVDYHVKYASRAVLDALYGMREGCDDIIIARKGLITDSSMANLMFFDGRHWFTPLHPLLEGTCRARLIAEGKIIPVDISPGDLRKYAGCKLVNAMRDPGEQEMILMSQVFPSIEN